MQAIKIEKTAISPSLADVIVEMDVRVDYTEGELTELRFIHSQKAIELAKLEFEKKQLVSSLDSQIKPLKNQSVGIVQQLRDGFEIQNKKTCGFKDFQDGTITFYTEEGEFVSKRRLLESEYQTTLKINPSF